MAVDRSVTGKRLHKLRKRDKYLLLAIFNIVWYCAAVLILSAFDKCVPDSLTVAWFSAWTVELALVAGIKIKERGESSGQFD